MHAMSMAHWLMAMPAFQVLRWLPPNDFLSFGKKGKSRIELDLENLSIVGKYAWILKQVLFFMKFRELILVFGILWYNRPEGVRLDHHSRRIHAIKNFFVLMVLLSTTSNFSFYFVIFCFHLFKWFEIVKTMIFHR